MTTSTNETFKTLYFLIKTVAEYDLKYLLLRVSEYKCLINRFWEFQTSQKLTLGTKNQT